MHFFGLPDTYSTLPDPYWHHTPEKILSAVSKMFLDENVLSELQHHENFWNRSQQRFSDQYGTLPFPQPTVHKTTTYTRENVQKLLLGVGGFMHHGKSTVAQYYCDHHNFSEYAFAGPLKEGCRYIFGFTTEQLYSDMKDQVDSFWGVTPRYIFQQVGTNIFRDLLKVYLPHIPLQSTLWIENFKRWLETQSKSVVVSDVRFVDEASVIRELGGTLIRVIRPSLLQQYGHLYQKHVSETDSVNIMYDFLLVNDGTLDELYAKSRQVLEKYLV